MDLVQRINTEFGKDIFAELLGTALLTQKRRGIPVRLFDTSPTSQEFYYPTGKYGFPTIHNYSSGKTYTPITAYAKAHNLSNSDAVKELKQKYIQTLATPQRAHIAPKIVEPPKAKPLDIPPSEIEHSIQNVERSILAKYLISVFGDVAKEVFRMYGLGNGYKSYDTAFWYQDKNGKYLNAKLMKYAGNGKRSKDLPPNWYHSIVKKENPIFGFFGEHLMAKDIWIVESEKSAIITAIYFYLNNEVDTVVWACGGLNRLNKAFENCTQNLSTCKITLVPDTDPEGKTYTKWHELCQKIAEQYGYDIGVTELLERNCSEAEKEAKYDIADLIISEHLVKASELPATTSENSERASEPSELIGGYEYNE